MLSFTCPSLSALPIDLTAGARYLADDALVADLIKAVPGLDYQRESFRPLAEVLEQPHTAAAPRRVLIVRAGGIGDLLFMTPALARLIAQHPDVEWTLSSRAPYHAVISHPALDTLKLIDYPVLCDVGKTYDTVVPLEDVIESDHETPAIQVFGRALGVDLPADTQPLFRVPSDGLLAAQQVYAKPPGMTFLGIGLRAGHAARTYPFPFLQQIARMLVDRDPNTVVFLFGEGRFVTPDGQEIEGIDNERIVWLPGNEPSLRESLALLGIMDGFIGPDSGLLHAAGALSIPSVGLFGPFSWQQRLPEGSSIYGLNGYAPCAPCHHLARLSAFPAGEKCAATGFCHALAALTPDRVVGALKKQLRELRGPRMKNGDLIQVQPYPIRSLFGPVVQRGDVHPELPKADLFHLGNWGAGAATIEEGTFLHALVLMLKPPRCLETGTETGWTAAWIAAALEANARGFLVTLEIDPKRAEQARQNLASVDLAHRVEVVEQPAQEWLAALSAFPYPPRLDFALLDTHIPLRLAELEALTPHLSPGAVVCIHDTAPEHPMREGCDLLKDLCAVPGFTVLHLPSPRGLTVMQWQEKPDEETRGQGDSGNAALSVSARDKPTT